jgi:hypothetical protein
MNRDSGMLVASKANFSSDSKKKNIMAVLLQNIGKSLT